MAPPQSVSEPSYSGLSLSPSLCPYASIMLLTVCCRFRDLTKTDSQALLCREHETRDRSVFSWMVKDDKQNGTQCELLVTVG